MRNILSAADWSQTALLGAAPKQFLLLMVGELDLGGIPTPVGQFLPYRSPSYSERASGADPASQRQRGGERQHISPAKGRGLGEDGREQNAAHRTPPCKARKRHLIEPATPLGQCEDPGEEHSGNEAE